VISAEGEGNRQTKTVTDFYAFLPLSVTSTSGRLDAAEARYIPTDHPTAPYQGGWLLRRAQLNPTEIELDEQWLVEFQDEAAMEGFPLSEDGMMMLDGRTFFLKTDVTFRAITRDPRQWFRYASTIDLIRALADSTNAPEKNEIAVFLHTRMVRPFLGMTLLFLSLPLILSGSSQNMFINLGLSIGTSAVFYGSIYVFQYFGSNGLLSPSLSAWVPVILFGTIASARWDRIRS